MNKRIRKKKITEKLRGRRMSTTWFYTETVWRRTGSQLKYGNCTPHKKYHVDAPIRKIGQLKPILIPPISQQILSMKQLIPSDMMSEHPTVRQMKKIAEVISPPTWVTNRNKFRQYIKGIDPEIMGYMIGHCRMKSKPPYDPSIFIFPPVGKLENPRDII